MTDVNKQYSNPSKRGLLASVVKKSLVTVVTVTKLKSS